MIDSQKELSTSAGFLANSSVLILLAVTIVLMIYHFLFQSLNWVKTGNKIPGPKYIPIFGNALEVIMAPKAHELVKYVLNRIKNEFFDEGVLRVWLGPKLIVALRDPRDVELILGGHKHMKKSDEYDFFEPWLGQGLLISKGEKWSSHRKMIVPTFHQSILKSFIPIFNQNAKKLIKSLEKNVGKSIDVHDYMSGITVDVLLETAMGVKKTHNENAGYKYAMAVMDMCNILYQRMVKIWLRPKCLFNITNLSSKQTELLNIIHGLTDQTIQQKKKDYFERRSKGQTSNLYEKAINDYEIDETNNKNPSFTYTAGNIGLKDDLDEDDFSDVGEKKRLAFLDFMIEASQMNGNKLTDEEIREEVNTIMFEGHDTTAAACSFVMVILGLYPEVQQKVVDELEEIFSEKPNRDDPITFTDILKMKYLERVILETMRLYPPVPLIARVLDEDVKLVSGDYTIPKGTTVLIIQYLIHRYHKLYKNPDKFNPDNFLPENCVKRHYYSYIPFSAGPRSCVGRKYAMLKVKVILASVIRAFKVKSFVPEDKFELQADIILKRNDGFEILLEKRY